MSVLLWRNQGAFCGRQILLINPIFVGTGGDVLNPGLVIEVPLDGFANAGLKGLSRFPA